jgi:hypothetical protein
MLGEAGYFFLGRLLEFFFFGLEYDMEFFFSLLFVIS